MSLKVDAKQSRYLDRFVRSLNRYPVMWTVGLLIPVYTFSFMIAFIVLVVDPRLHSPFITFVGLAFAAIIVMGYHWSMTRYQRASSAAQAIQFCAGLLPIVGGFFLITISAMAS